MRWSRKMTGIALLMTLVAGITGCSEGAHPRTATIDQWDNLPVINSPITANSDVKLLNARVEVATEAAPVVTPSLVQPKPAQPASNSATDTSNPTMTDYERIDAIMAKYNVYPEAGTQFRIAPMPAGCIGADGCTQFKYYTDTGVAFDYIITIAPGQLTEYLLIHEIGHARGIRDECGADNFARSILGPVPTHYC